MTEKDRLYQRQKFSVPFKYTEEYPPVAPATHVLPKPESAMIHYKGIITNSCFDGFCFETDFFIEPGTEIKAKMIAPVPLKLGSEKYSECKLIVKWCKKNKIGSKNIYTAGVQRISGNRLPILDFKKRSFASLKVV